MKILSQIAIIFALCLLGEVISALLPFPFPSAITAMLLLALALFSGLLKVEQIKEKSDFLLSNMAFFFVPAGVGVIEYFSFIAPFWWQFVLAALLATFMVFAATAGTVSLVLKLEKRRKAT